MSSTPDFSQQQPQRSASFGDDGLYDSSRPEEASPLTVQVQEQLDEGSQRSLEALQRSSSAIFDYVRRNPVRVAIGAAGVAGVAALLAAWSRRANRY